MVAETLSIKVSKAEKNLLRKCAKRQRQTTSDLLRSALRSVLASPEVDDSSLLERHSHLFEKLDRGPGDLSTNRSRMSSYGR